MKHISKILYRKIPYENFVPIYPDLISEGEEIVRAFDRHSNMQNRDSQKTCYQI